MYASFTRTCQKYVHILYLCTRMYEERVAVMTVLTSIERTVSLGQGERDPDKDPYFPNPVS